MGTLQVVGRSWVLYCSAVCCTVIVGRSWVFYRSAGCCIVIVGRSWVFYRSAVCCTVIVGRSWVLYRSAVCCIVIVGRSWVLFEMKDDLGTVSYCWPVLGTLLQDGYGYLEALWPVLGTVLQDGCPYLIVGRLLVEPDAVLVVRVVAGSATLKLQHKPSSSMWWPFVPLRTTEAQLRNILINERQRTRKTYSKEDRSQLPQKRHTPGFRQTSLRQGKFYN